MDEPIFLTEEEIRQITGAIKPTTQTKRLKMLGFTVKVRPDNRPIVARGNFLAVMAATGSGTKEQSHQPDFGAI